MIYLTLLAIAVTLYLGFSRKINVGVVGTLFALLIGCFFMRLSPGKIFGFLPAKIIFKIVPITMFYGFALENGTLNLLIDKLLYKTSRWIHLLPWFVYLVCILLSMSGIGAGALGSIMAPLVLPIAIVANLDLTVVCVALAMGCAAGSSFVTSEGGTISLSIIEQTVFANDSLSIGIHTWVFMLFCFTSILGILFVVRKAFKRPEKVFSMEKPGEFNSIQIKNLFLIGVVVALLIVPLVLNTLFHSELTTFLYRNLDIGFVMLLGAFLAHILGLGKIDTVIKKRIPWSSITVICGMTILISVAVEAGLADVITGLLVNSVPRYLVVSVMALCAGVLSYFCSVVGVVLPTLYPLVEGIAAATGIAPASLFCAVFVGASSTSVSPFSTGGSIIVSCCTDESKRDLLIRQLLMMAFFSILGVAIAFLLF